MRELGEVKRFGDNKPRTKEHFRLWDLQSTGRQIAEGMAFGSCFAAGFTAGGRMLALAGGAVFDGGVQLFDTAPSSSGLPGGKLRHLRTFKGILRKMGTVCNVRGSAPVDSNDCEGDVRTGGAVHSYGHVSNLATCSPAATAAGTQPKGTGVQMWAREGWAARPTPSSSNAAMVRRVSAL